MKYLLLIPTFLSVVAFAGNTHFNPTASHIVLAELDELEKVNATIIKKDKELNIAFASLSGKQLQKLHEHSHERGACAGFESFGHEMPPNFEIKSKEIFSVLREQRARNLRYNQMPPSEKILNVQFDQKIKDAVEEVNTKNLNEWVVWLSSFPTRYYRSNNKNDHVVQMKDRLDRMVMGAEIPVEVEVVQHSNIDQKSLRVRFVGSEKPDEIVVMGGHFDSILSWGSNGRAPGADDNASGSSCIVEAMRILLTKGQPKRTVEFMWYAGEEGGLLGSKDIAQKYKAANKNVVAALQLDMTMHPGSGVGTMAFINDYTNASLTDHLRELNRLYVGAKAVNSKCGYGCSDHASWHRAGYPASFPFEARKNDMNRKIHTTNDVINNQSSFEHAKVFAQLAVAFGMDLGNADSVKLH